MYTKRTLRHMPYYTRNYAERINALEITVRRLKAQLSVVHKLELNGELFLGRPARLSKAETKNLWEVFSQQE